MRSPRQAENLDRLIPGAIDAALAFPPSSSWKVTMAGAPTDACAGSIEGIDAQSVPLVVLWIAAVFRRCSPAAYESVSPTANSVAALPMPQRAVRDIGIPTAVVILPTCLSDAGRRTEFNGLVLKIEREMVVQAHIEHCWRRRLQESRSSRGTSKPAVAGWSARRPGEHRPR